MPSLLLQRLALFMVGLGLSGCHLRARHPEAPADLQLEKVVLYRNGVGYFDHVGIVENGHLRLRVPREHLNDILKSLTVMDSKGQVLSVSMPLDGRAFGKQDIVQHGYLHETLRALQGTPVELRLNRLRNHTIRGRIFLVEAIGRVKDDVKIASEAEQEFRISLVDGEKISTARISEIDSIKLLDHGILLSLHRMLDASPGSNSLHLVEVDLELSSSAAREVSVAYVVEAPIWKPTYRIVIPGDGKNEVLLQGWAVVHNISGDDWKDVQLSLAAGAPIAFRYDMHRPSHVTREDLSWVQSQKHAQAAVGDGTQVEQMEAPEAEDSAMEAAQDEEPEEEAVDDEAGGEDVAMKEVIDASSLDVASASAARKRRSKKALAAPSAPPRPRGIDSFSKSVPATQQSRQLAGLTQISLSQRVNVPQGRSSMLAFVNERVQGKAALLYREGGAGSGYSNNPYRVLRFRNQTPFVLESGPISLYAGGTFVGEGIAEAIASGSWATIPYAVETEVEIVSDAVEEDSPLRVLRISGGLMDVEQFSQQKVTWRARATEANKDRSVYIDQPRSGERFELVTPLPESGEVEVFPDFYRFHFKIPANESRASLDVVEKTPSRFTVSIWDGNAVELLDHALAVENISAAAKRKLTPIIDLRRELASMDTKIRSLSRQRAELERRADQIRRNLKVIEKDRAARDLRKQLTTQLVEISREVDAAGREVVRLRSGRLDMRLKLEKALQNLDLQLSPSTKKEESASGELAKEPQVAPSMKEEKPAKP